VVIATGEFNTETPWHERSTDIPHKGKCGIRGPTVFKALGGVFAELRLPKPDWRAGKRGVFMAQEDESEWGGVVVELLAREPVRLDRIVGIGHP